MGWMAWTWQTAVFFALIASVLVVMSLLAIYRPEIPRRGILRFPTTRGDRLFVSMIGSAFIFILWIRVTGGDNVYYPIVGAILYSVAMFRYA